MCETERQVAAALPNLTHKRRRKIHRVETRLCSALVIKLSLQPGDEVQGVRGRVGDHEDVRGRAPISAVARYSG